MKMSLFSFPRRPLLPHLGYASNLNKKHEPKPREWPTRSLYYTSPDVWSQLLHSQLIEMMKTCQLLNNRHHSYMRYQIT